MSKKVTNSKSNEKRMTKQFSEKQIFSMVTDAILEKMRDKQRFAISMGYIELGYASVSYLPLTDEEISIIQEARYLHGADDSSLEDKLRMMGGQEELIKRLKEEADCNADEYIIVDCDIYNYRYEIGIRVYLPEENRILNQSLYLTEQKFCELLKMHIKHKNRVSLNTMVYEKPRLASELYRRLVGMLNFCTDDYEANGYHNYTKPFAVELSDFQEITDGVFNPRRDELGLFKENYNEMEKFLEKYAIKIDFLAFNIEEKGFCKTSTCVVFTCLNMEMSMFCEYNEEDNHTFGILDKIIVKACDVCDALNLKDYKDLAKYCEEHYNTKDAVRDFRNDMLKLCPEAIVEG